MWRAAYVEALSRFDELAISCRINRLRARHPAEHGIIIATMTANMTMLAGVDRVRAPL